MVTTKDVIQALREIPNDLLNEDYRDCIEVALADKDRIDVVQEHIAALQGITHKETSTVRELLDSLFF